MKPRDRAADSTRPPRSTCPVACALDLFGDRWTLLVIRDLFGGKSRFGEFLASEEGIPTNILADRLERLEASGAIESETYQKNPPRYTYSLTKKGRDLRPVVAALALWAIHHLPKTQPSDRTMAALRP